MPEQFVWLIFLLPLISFAVISLYVKPFISNNPRLSGYITIGAIGGSLLLSIWALATVMSSPTMK